jgi:cell division transport system permease protein
MSVKPRQKNRFKKISLTTTLSMSLVLFLIGLVSLLIFVARDLSVYVKENINLSIILEDKIMQSDMDRIEEFISLSPFTKSVVYISKEDALKDHIASLGENPEDFLGYNPLLASLEVKLKADYANTDSVAVIESSFKDFVGINQIAYQKDLVSLINNNVSKLSFLLLCLTIVLMIVSVALINNTVRLAVFSNRFLINTMKLVGANRSFILKPYLKQAVIHGIVAGIFSLVLLTFMVAYVQIEFGMVAKIINPVSSMIVTLIVLVSGVILSGLSTYFAVSKYLKMTTNEMYEL